MSDSLMLEATGEGVERLTDVLSVCSQWKNDPPKFEGWKKDAGTIVFTRFCSDDFIAFPTTLTSEQAASIAAKYIDNLPTPEWPREPDIDGHCKKGWKVVHDDSMTTIEPFWMIYHK